MIGDIIGQETVDVYRAWDSWSRSRNGDVELSPEEDPNRIIDIDVAPEGDNPLVFEDESQVRAALEGLLERAEAGDAQNGDFIERKIKASLLQLRLQAGEEVAFDEHARTAMGIAELEPIDEGALDNQQERLDARLKRHGLRFDRSHSDKFEERMVLRWPRERIRQLLLETNDQAVSLIRWYTGVSPEIEPEIAEASEPWAGWFGTKAPGELFLKMNVHPRVKHTVARIAAIAIHENGHAAQFSNWKEAILLGDMSPAMGITTLHTPENAQAEAYALLIEQIGLRAARGDGAWRHHWQADYHDYLERAWYNIHLMSAGGEDPAKVMDYAAERLPFDSLQVIRDDLEAYLKDPALKAYLICYDPGLEAVRPVLSLPAAEQRRAIRWLGSQPLTLDQIKAGISQAAEQRLAVSS